MNRRNRKKWFFIALIILALIVLPTGTPEDFITTFIFIWVLGIWGYLLLALAVLLLILLLPKRYRRRLHF